MRIITNLRLKQKKSAINNNRTLHYLYTLGLFVQCLYCVSCQYSCCCWRQFDSFKWYSCIQSSELDSPMLKYNARIAFFSLSKEQFRKNEKQNSITNDPVLNGQPECCLCLGCCLQQQQKTIEIVFIYTGHTVHCAVEIVTDSLLIIQSLTWLIKLMSQKLCDCLECSVDIAF